MWVENDIQDATMTMTRETRVPSMRRGMGGSGVDQNAEQQSTVAGSQGWKGVGAML